MAVDGVRKWGKREGEREFGGGGSGMKVILNYLV